MAMRVLLVLAVVACTDPPPTSLPEGRYQLAWGDASETPTDEASALLALHHLAVVPGQVVLGPYALPMEFAGKTCACAPPSADGPGYALCSDGVILTGTIGWTQWIAVTATPI